MQILTMEIESSRYSEGAHWDSGADCYVEECNLWIADGFDHSELAEYELLELADEDDPNVRYASKAKVKEWYSDLMVVDGIEWHVFREDAKVCDVCNEQIAEDDDDYHDYHEPDCKCYRGTPGGCGHGCGCNGIAHAECCPECQADDMDSMNGFYGISDFDSASGVPFCDTQSSNEEKSQFQMELPIVN